MGIHVLALAVHVGHRVRQRRPARSCLPRSVQQHPDREIIASFPGLSQTTGARILRELGDDRERFTDVRAVKAYAGSAPVTRASGKSISVTHRRIKNDRLAAASWIWASVPTPTTQPPVT